MKTLLMHVILLALLAISAIGATDGGIMRLYSGFQNPPRQYTVRPFWFWNGRLDAREVEWQIRQMVEQGVYGAYIHNRTGLETPYLSEQYYDVVKAGFKKARELGFLFGFVDEYEWPSGEARDIWLPGLPSRVIAANPEFRMRSLGYLEKDAQGPGRVETGAVEHFQFAVAARLLDDNSIDPASLTDISARVEGGRLRWEAPPGRWRSMVFYLYPTQGRDGGLVDILNAAAIRKFLDLTYEQYYKRFGEHYGSTIDSTYVDHEGDYGYRIAWTPQLFQTFERLKGYDLRKYLPLLMHDGGRQTPKVRCDYLDVISELYYQAFFKQVTDWCEAHKIKISGHVWEETLQMEAAFEGDLQRIMRGWSWPGVDSLWDRGRSPRDFKAAGSVAHFRGTRFTCENQGLQGADSYLDFQKMRLGTNMIAAWGVNLFIPHAFNYNRQRIEYPPDWFYHEPYWKYFKHYADYARRLSYMNDGGQHVADLLVFQPTESAWAHSEPVFSSKSAYIPSKWNNPLDTINTCYTDIMNRLSQERWDFDVADSHYLLQSELKNRRLAIGNEAFRVLILPPATTMRRDVLRKIRSFYDQGGIVIGIRILPGASMEEGRDDALVAETVRHIFGNDTGGASRSNANSAGGKAFFVKDDVEEIFKLLEANLRQDIKILDGRKDHLFYLHRRKENVDFYWMVNDSDTAREHTFLFNIKGSAEKWDAGDASREPLYHRKTVDGTEARLRFDPWEAYYVVFRSSGAAGGTAQVTHTNMERISLVTADKAVVRVRGFGALAGTNSFFAEAQDNTGRKYRGQVQVPRTLPVIDLGGRWSFQPENARLAAPYAAMKPDPTGDAQRLGWHTREFKSDDWSRVWLSQERLTVRDWWVIGPFPNDDHRGFMEAYPPEKSIDLQGSYADADGSSRRWIRWSSDNYKVDLDQALRMPRGKNWVTSYAATYVYSPTARQAQFRIVADNNAKLWVNGKNLLDLHIHPFYFEMREDFALTRPAELKPGWNEILVKVSKCAGARWWAFMLRVTDQDGRNFDDLTFSPEKRQGPAPDAARSAAGQGRTWYRIPVPAGAVEARLPSFKSAVSVFYNGNQIQADPSGLVRLPGPAEGGGNVLVLSTGSREVVAGAPEFLLGRAAMELGSWTANGLPYYSGSAAYEKEFDLPREYPGNKIILDCGQVGVVAEVWVNDRPAGTRVWLPYTFDISKLLRPGKNKVKILVTNTMESARAVENHEPKLQKIQLNGLLGPVRIIPFKQVDLSCMPIN